MEPLRIFVGFDENEAVAYHTFCNSVLRYASIPVAFIPLHLGNLRGVYEETHNMTNPDLIQDGYEPSNAFIYSRFLVPYLSGYTGWSLYFDADMIVRRDIKELYDLRDRMCAIQLVKHPDYETKATIKYATASQVNGSINRNYKRKNWSSVIMWNNQYCKALSPSYISEASGAELHQFKWLDDNRIGSLPPEWNYLAQEFGKLPGDELPANTHYTLGTPCWAEWSEGAYANEWHKELLLAMSAYRETPVEMVLRSNQLLVEAETEEKSAA